MSTKKSNYLEIFIPSFKIYNKYFNQIFIISAMLLIPTVIGYMGLSFIAGLFIDSPTMLTLVFTFVALPYLAFIFTPVARATIFVTNKTLKKVEVNLKEIINFSFERYLYFALNTAVYYIAVFVGISLFVLPGVILIIFTPFFMNELECNQEGAWEAVKESAKIVRKDVVYYFGYIVTVATFSLSLLFLSLQIFTSLSFYLEAYSSSSFVKALATCVAFFIVFVLCKVFSVSTAVMFDDTNKFLGNGK